MKKGLRLFVLFVMVLLMAFSGSILFYSEDVSAQTCDYGCCTDSDCDFGYQCIGEDFAQCDQPCACAGGEQCCVGECDVGFGSCELRHPTCCFGPACPSGSECVKPGCGNGVTNAGETCDLGGVCLEGGDDCDTDIGDSDCDNPNDICIPKNDGTCEWCQQEGLSSGLCGNFIINTGEECDDGGLCSVSGTPCSTSNRDADCPGGEYCGVNEENGCEDPGCNYGGGWLCGSGARDNVPYVEECDDAVYGDGDGCNLGCKIERGWSCIGDFGQPSVCTPLQCFDLDDNDNDFKYDYFDMGCHVDGNTQNISSYFPEDNDETDVFIGITCGSDNDVILSLEDYTNAHGEVYNGLGEYQVEVCYSHIFGSPYTGANPHQCEAGSNTVVRLSGTTNAHAETPQSNSGGYTDVCYGGLQCTSTNNECSTLGTSFREVVSLSGNTNAHIEERNENTGYNVRICCTLGDFIKLEWRDYAGAKIGRSEGIQSFVNRTVKLYTESNLGDGTDVSFEVFEGDPAACSNNNPDNPPCTFHQDIRTIEKGTELHATVSGGVAVGEWTITDDDMGAANPFGTENFPGEFYFKASILGKGNYSEILEVNDVEGPNTLPSANISGPLHRQIYYVGTEIEFKHRSIDLEGPLDVEWEIEQNGELYTTTEDTFNLTFGTDFGGEGQATIILRVSDSQGYEDETQIAILLLSSPGVLAYINKPFHKEIVVNDSLVIVFNATDSYAVDSAGTPCPAVTCLAGDCPYQTINVPVDCNTEVNVTLVNNNPGFNPLNFSWVFSDDSTFEFKGTGLVSGRHAYPSQSSDLHDKWITLLVNYTNMNLVEDTERIFTLLDGAQCLGGKWLINVINGKVISKQYTLNTPACAGFDGEFGTGDDCCPGGYICDEGAQGCIIPDNVPGACSDYASDIECNDDLFGLGDSSDGPPNDPGLAECERARNGISYQCDCAWDDSNVEEKCVLKQTALNNTDPNLCTSYVCLYSNTIVEECTNGWMTVDVQADFECNNFNACSACPSAEEVGCVSGQKQVPCGQLRFELGFFDYKQFVAAALIIALIYFFVIKAEKKK